MTLENTINNRCDELLERFAIKITNKLGSWQGVDLATGAVWGTFPSKECAVDSIWASKTRNANNL